jgi:hypothetical protein
MQLANGFIYRYVENLYEVVNDETLKFSAQVNYAIQKNLRNLLTIYQELEQERLRVCREYSTGLDDDGVFLFEDKEKRIKAEKELNDLMFDTQEVPIIKFKIEALGDIQLTSRQMDTLMLMVKDEEGQE